MRCSYLVTAIGSLLTAHLAVAHADAAKARPLDAPATCVAPTENQGLAAAISTAPKLLGKIKLTHGKAKVAFGIRIKVRTGYMPAGHGQPGGEELVGMSVENVAAIKQDGINSRNTLDVHGLDPVRIGTQRVTLRALPSKRKQARYEATVEDLGCLEQYTHPPLARSGDAVMVWLSTAAVASYRLSDGEWFEQVPSAGVDITSGLQTNPARTEVKGQQAWIALNLFDNLSGTGTSMRITNDVFVAGAKLTTPAYVAEVLDVRLDPDATRIENLVITTSGIPDIAALVRIVRR